jgi:hypothetical protein
VARRVSLELRLPPGRRRPQPAATLVWRNSSSRRRNCCVDTDALEAAKRSGGGGAMGGELGTVGDVAAWAAPTGYGGGPARRLGCGSGAARAWRRLCRAARALRAWMAPQSGAVAGGRRRVGREAAHCAAAAAAAWLWRPFGHSSRAA